MPYDPQRLGANVKAAREPLSQRAFGTKSGLSHICINDIENAHHSPTVRTLCKIAEAAGVTLAELVEGVDT